MTIMLTNYDQKKKNPTKSKNKSKVDELLAGLSEKEKKELLEKLSK